MIYSSRVRVDCNQLALFVAPANDFVEMTVQDIVKEFQYADCRPMATPADGCEHLRPATTEDATFTDIGLYQRALGT